MSNKNEPSLNDVLGICSKFFKELHETCEKYKMSLPGVKKGTLTFSQKNVPEAKPTKKKIYDPLKGDPNAPKKPIIQAYLMYYSDIRSQTQKEHPDLPNKDLTKIIADEWNSMPKDKRAKFEEKARKNKEEYEASLEEYLKTNPAMREALSQKGKKRKSSASLLKPPSANGKSDVISIDDSDDGDTSTNLNGKRQHSSSEDDSDDSDDDDSSDGRKKVKK